jgi:competence/damage-inducible protein CinA-like protein
MPILEIITIGTELLLGEIIDSNSTYIARTLRDHGIDIYRITTIGDNPNRIASAIQEALARADIIITTGGLGPTIDDPTRQAVAQATGNDLVFLQELWLQILDRFKLHGREPTANNRRQAYIPEGAIPIENQVGTAPCFIVEIDQACVISLPGVPREMEYILHNKIIPYLSDKYALKTQIIKATVLHASTLGESAIDEIIADLEQLSNPTVGLLAHPGQVDIRVTAKAESEAQALKLSQPIIEEIEYRLGDAIYGRDEETLEGCICQSLRNQSQPLLFVEFGLENSLSMRIKKCGLELVQTEAIFQQPVNVEDFTAVIRALHPEERKKQFFGAALILDERVTLYLVFGDSFTHLGKIKYYGGPREYAQIWAQNAGLDFLRHQLKSNNDLKVLGEL